MHALEMIVERNAKAAGITVAENMKDARAGQCISRAGDRHCSTTTSRDRPLDCSVGDMGFDSPHGTLAPRL